MAKRVVLIHWNAAEAEERAVRIRAAGYSVTCHCDQGRDGLLRVRTQPPDAVIIDLARLPSQGRDVAVWLRQQAATRRVPLVMVAGDPTKSARVRELLPDAVWTEADAEVEALRAALANPPADPVVPGAMAGYSGTPLPKKLGIKGQSGVLLVHAPDGFESLLGDLPEGAVITRDRARQADVVVLFAPSRADLEAAFAAAVNAMADGGRLWIAWPKKASGMSSDLTQQAVRSHGLERGLVDYKIAAVDETWSALCFARRKSDKNTG